jgi:hypothetical protein
MSTSDQPENGKNLTVYFTKKQFPVTFASLFNKAAGGPWCNGSTTDFGSVC